MDTKIVIKEWLTLEEVANYLCFSKEKVYLLIKQGHIPAIKIGRHWRFNKNQIDEWMLNQKFNKAKIDNKQDAFIKIEDFKYDHSDEEIDITVHNQINDINILNELWGVYFSTFEKNKEVAAQDQRSYNERMLIDALKDNDYIKFILHKNGDIGGLGLLTNNLDKARIVYMNPDYYKNKYPIFSKEGKIFYVTALSVLPHIRGLKGIIKLLIKMIQFINSNEAIVAFDYSENKNRFLPTLIHTLAEKSGIPVIGNKLDSQTYYEIYGKNNRTPE